MGTLDTPITGGIMGTILIITDIRITPIAPIPITDLTTSSGASHAEADRLKWQRQPGLCHFL